MTTPKIENNYVELITTRTGTISKIVSGKFCVRHFPMGTSIFEHCPFLEITLASLQENEDSRIAGLLLELDNEEYLVEVDIDHRPDDSISVLIQNRTEVYKTIEQLNQNRNEMFLMESQLVKKNKELERLKLDAERANNDKSRFLAMISHEIRNPLNAILGYSELLASETIEKNQEYTNFLNLAGNDLRTIVDDILDLSRLQAGKLTLAHESFNICMLIRSSVQDFQSQLKNGNIIVFNPPAKTPIFVCGDSVRVKQILSNLINNSMKFTKNGQIEIAYDIKPNESRKVEVSVQVKDTGRGMSSAQISTIFNEYEQVKLDDNRIEGGAGLGLSIVKKLIKAMNGSIEVESSLGVGSTFYISLPFELANEQETQSSKEEKNNLVSLDKKRILIADDYLMNRSILAHMLQNVGAETILVENGNDAFNALKNHVYDLAFLDIDMPGLRGDAIVEMKEAFLQKNKSIHLIAVTGEAQEEKHKDYISKGFAAILTKPLSTDTLNATLTKLLVH